MHRALLQNIVKERLTRKIFQNQHLYIRIRSPSASACFGGYCGGMCTIPLCAFGSRGQGHPSHRRVLCLWKSGDRRTFGLRLREQFGRGSVAPWLRKSPKREAADFGV